MRRSKIKATVCLGRRKPVTSPKDKEKADVSEYDETTLPNNTTESESLEIPEIEKTNSSTCQAVTDSHATTSQPAPYTGISLTSIPIADQEHQSDATVAPNSKTVNGLTETSPENSSPPGSRSLLSRSKIKAVPKFKSKKFVPNITLSEDDKSKSDCIKESPEPTVSASSPSQECTLNSTVVTSIPEVLSVTPPSPTKLCRSKVKAVPTLGNRKTIPSTSDPEDGIKGSHSSRTRTESQSSTISGIQDMTVEQPPTPKKFEGSLEMRRKPRRSESSKKLAEAKREFNKKYVDGKPDYKKLTMMDLIFFNPTTNPMKYEKKKSDAKDASTKPDEQTEEDVDSPSVVGDNPSENNDEQMSSSDDEDQIAAPRIKIGPTGEIILDEKSLVIENKKVKKAQEAIQRSETLDGDLDRPYGVFKRFKRSKDWTQSETVKFYRALSTVGTDFTLMTELFPKRTRRELKIKFKKEEKTNRALVDQAIMKPCNFNYEELKSEFEMMDIETNEIEQQQIREKELNKKKQNMKSAKLVNLTQNNSSIDDTQDNSCNITSVKKVEKPARKRNTKPKKLKLQKSTKKLDILSALSESEPSDPDSTDSEEPLIKNTTQTTRYGRKTKCREIYEANTDPIEELIVHKKIRKLNPEPEPTQKPGSIMMVSSETPDGQSVVKIFMVTDDKRTNGDKDENSTQNLLPIAMIRTDHTDDEVEEEIVENNYTIPADSEETLKTATLEETIEESGNNKENQEERKRQ